MEEYLHRSRVREIMDGLGFMGLSLGLSLLWFVFLWGLTVPALLSGCALWLLVLLLRRKTRDGRLKQKEEKLRRRIGGELAVERLLFCPAEKAHFETAVLLSLRYPLTLLQSGTGGILCRWREEKALVCFCQLPVADAVGPKEVLSLQRECASRGADRGILCAPCAVSDAARIQAEGQIPVSFLSRDALIGLFGRANPATDAQLVALGQRKKKSGRAAWLPLILSPRRTARYACYGALLIGMYELTKLIYYAVPGLVCLGLAAACRCRKETEEIL